MESVRAYVLSVTTVAILCGLVKSLGKVTAQGDILGLLCGLVLLFTAAAPLGSIELEELTDWLPETRLQAQAMVDAGKDSAGRDMEERIKQQTQAYILDKAAEYGAEIEVEVNISGTWPMVPESVRICGQLSPFQKNQLSRMISEDLGIAEEALRWNP